MTTSQQRIDFLDIWPEAPGGVPGTSTPVPDGLECDESEFVICCFALCDWGGYKIADDQIQIRGRA